MPLAPQASRRDSSRFDPCIAPWPGGRSPGGCRRRVVVRSRASGAGRGERVSPDGPPIAANRRGSRRRRHASGHREGGDIRRERGGRSPPPRCGVSLAGAVPALSPRRLPMSRTATGVALCAQLGQPGEKPLAASGLVSNQSRYRLPSRRQDSATRNSRPLQRESSMGIFSALRRPERLLALFLVDRRAPLATTTADTVSGNSIFEPGDPAQPAGCDQTSPTLGPLDSSSRLLALQIVAGSRQLVHGHPGEVARWQQ